jgi:hypothetical protein
MSTLFVRQSRQGDWGRINDTTPEDTSFGIDVLSDIVNFECETSVWQVDSRDDAEVDRLTAALHQRSTKRLSDITFRFVSEWQIKQLGLTKKQTRGDSLDDVLNGSGKHWIIETPSVRHAILLAKGLTTQEPKFYAQDTVMRHFARSIVEKRIKTESVSPELWKILILKGLITLSTSEAPQL